MLDLRMEEGLGMCSDKLAMSKHQETYAKLAKEEEVRAYGGEQDRDESAQESDEAPVVET